MIAIPAIVIIAVIFVVILRLMITRESYEEASSDDEAHPLEEIAESVAEAAADVQDGEGDDAAFEDGVNEEEEQETRMDVIYEPAHNERLTLESIDEELEKKLSKKLDDMPPIPRATIDLLPLLSSPRTNARDIARVIATDPLLCGKILKRVNSCFYSLQTKIDSIQHAIALLGFDNIRAISLRESFDSMLHPEPVEGLNANLLWRHMAAVGLFSKHLARKVRGVDPDLVGSAALLHDIGLLVMMAQDRDALGKTLRLSESNRESLCKAEEKLHGYNHQVLGGMLGRKWNLSDELCSAIGSHHSPFLEEGPDKVTGIIWLSHSVAFELGFAHRPVYYPVEDCEELAKALHLMWPVTKYINEPMLRDLQRTLSLWDALSHKEPVKDVPEEWRDVVAKY